MGITIKKKLTVKTIKAGAMPGEAAPAEGAPVEGAPVDGAAVPAEGAAPAAEASNPAPAMMHPPGYAGPAVKPASYTVAGIFAIITTIFFIILIALQYFEWDTYTGCFPEMGPGGMSRPMAPVSAEVAAPAVPAAPVAAEPVKAEAAKEAPKTETPK